MKVMDKYLFKEWRNSFFSVFIALILIILGTQATSLLAKSSRGDTPTEVVMWLILLRIPTSLELILPATMMISVILTFRRMSQDQEIVVMQSVGLGSTYFVKRLCVWSIPIIALNLVSNLWLTPWSFQKSAELINSSNINAVFNLQDKTFLPFEQGLIYIEKIDAKGALHDVIIDQLQTNSKLYTLAKQGRIVKRNHQTWLILQDGYFYQNLLSDTDELVQNKFSQLEISLSKNENKLASKRLDSNYALELYNSDSLEALVLLQWRIFLPFCILVLALWGLEFSKTRPRTTSSLKLFVAIVFFVIFYNVSYYLRVWGGYGIIPLSLSVWLSPVLFSLPLFWLLKPSRGMS